MEFFTMEEVVEILQSLISAVNFLHQLEVSHNSIKLTNIFYHERVAKLGGLHDPINLF
jgi:serine/threonine protein kinase